MPEAQTSTQTAGETAEDIGAIIGGMSGSEQPITKPGENTGDAEKGKSTNDGGKGGEIQHPAWFSQINDQIKSDADKAGKLSKFEKLSDLANALLELSFH